MKKVNLKSLNKVSKFIFIGLFVVAILSVILGIYGCSSVNIDIGIGCFVIAGSIIAIAIVLNVLFSAIFEIADSVNMLIDKVNNDNKDD